MSRLSSFTPKAVIGLAAVVFCGTSFVQANTSSWIGPDSDFNTASNWSNGEPTDIAEFNTSSPLSLYFSREDSAITGPNPTSLNGFHFNPGAAAYTFNLSGATRHRNTLILTGPGIMNDSGNQQTFSNAGGQIRFMNAASAGGNVTYINMMNYDYYAPSSMSFENNSSAGSATIINNRGGFLTFRNTSTAADARITNDGGNTSFGDNATAGHATILNNIANPPTPAAPHFSGTPTPH